MLTISAGSLLQQLCDVYGWTYCVDRIIPDCHDPEFCVIVHPYAPGNFIHPACSCCVMWGGDCFAEEHVSIPIQLGILIESFLEVKYDWPMRADFVENVLSDLGLTWIRGLASVDASRHTYDGQETTNFIRISPDFCSRGVYLVQICRHLVDNHGHLALTEVEIVPSMDALQDVLMAQFRRMCGIDARGRSSQLCVVS